MEKKIALSQLTLPKKNNPRWVDGWMDGCMMNGWMDTHTHTYKQIILYKTSKTPKQFSLTVVVFNTYVYTYIPVSCRASVTRLETLLQLAPYLVLLQFSVSLY